MSDGERAVADRRPRGDSPRRPQCPGLPDNVWAKKYSITEVPPDRWSVADYYDPDPTAPAKTYSKIGAWVRGFQFDWKRWHIPPRVAGQWTRGSSGRSPSPRRPWPTTATRRSRSTPSAPPSSSATRWRGSGTTSPRSASPSRVPPAAARGEGVPRPPRRRPQRHSVALERGRDEGASRDHRGHDAGGALEHPVGRVANVLNLRGRTSRPTRRAHPPSPPSTPRSTCSWPPLRRGRHRRRRPQHGHELVREVLEDRRALGDGDAAFRRRRRRLRDGRGLGGLPAEAPGRRGAGRRPGLRGRARPRRLLGRQGQGHHRSQPIGQQLATARAWRNAGLDPTTAGLIEAHGTSTKVGDVVEVESLATVFKGAARASIALGPRRATSAT